MMYPASLNCLIATLMLCGLCLQNCQSSFRATSEDYVLKKSRKISDDAPGTNQASVPDVQPSVRFDAPRSKLPTAVLATLPSVTTSTVQVASSTYHLSVRPDTVSGRALASSTESEEPDTKPAVGSTTQVTGCFSVGFLASLRSLPLTVSPLVFGSRAWRQYLGEVGVEPPLPPDIDEILGSPCPFWPGKAVKDTHLLVLIPSTVDGKAFTLDLLGELVQNPRVCGHSTRYFLYDDEVQQSLGDAYPCSSYWVLMTREVLPGTRNKPYTAQQALISAQTTRVGDPAYEMPHVLEAATAILSYYVFSGHRLYEGFLDDKSEIPSTSTYCSELLEDVFGHPSPITVGRFCSRGLVLIVGSAEDEEFGVSCLRKFGTRRYRPSALLHSFGPEEWSRYFGSVDPAPPLPVHIVATLNGPCPFWPGKAVKDTHLLVLIPSTVAGQPFSLNFLGTLTQHPKGGGYPTEYRYYDSDIREQFGTQSPGYSYWVLMTREVLDGSRDKDYVSQKALVAYHASRTGLPYRLPGVLEAATAILSHYVRSGERLYTNDPWTYTRCQELVAWDFGNYPAVVGGFSHRGLCVDDSSFYDVGRYRGVASLWKF
jgi:hypothetical protein